MEILPINNNAPAVTTYEPHVTRQDAEEQRKLIHAVKAVNATDLFGQDNELTFVLDRNTRRAVVRIVNRETREVVEQIPSEYVLRMAEELKRT
jgi:uncharacterized FlaG/YvyC family protein